MQITAVVPLKGFTDAKERLSPHLTPEARIRLAAATAARVVTACREADLPTLVVTDDPEVRSMADRLGAGTVLDPGSGLNLAVRTALAGLEHWVVVHGDLPLLDADAMSTVAALLNRGFWVLGPALDGGTNVLGGHGRFDPSFGLGSFHRHLSAVSRRPHRIVVTPATAVEIDTPSDLSAAARLPGGGWVRQFLS